MNIFSRSSQLKWFLFLAIILTLGNFFGCSNRGRKMEGYQTVQKELQARIVYYSMPG